MSGYQIKIKYTVITFSLFVFALPILVQGAGFYFGTETQEIGVGEVFEVGVFLDTSGEKINALEGQVLFSAPYLEFKEVRDGGSIISFWVERPRELDGSVGFGGIIPGGFSGGRGYLFSVIFEAKQVGAFSIQSENERLLLNDGVGTAIQVQDAPITLSIIDAATGREFLPPVDTEIPESFVPEIGRDASIAAGNWFIVFSTQDKLSGIDEYAVKERMPWYSWQGLSRRSSWRATASPFILQDQSLRSYIFVKAIDKTGNERVVTLAPRVSIPFYDNLLIWGIIVTLMATAYILWFIRRKKGLGGQN